MPDQSTNQLGQFSMMAKSQFGTKSQFVGSNHFKTSQLKSQFSLTSQFGSNHFKNTSVANSGQFGRSNNKQFSSTNNDQFGATNAGPTIQQSSSAQFRLTNAGQFGAATNTGQFKSHFNSQFTNSTDSLGSSDSQFGQGNQLNANRNQPGATNQFGSMPQNQLGNASQFGGSSSSSTFPSISAGQFSSNRSQFALKSQYGNQFNNQFNNQDGNQFASSGRASAGSAFNGAVNNTTSVQEHVRSTSHSTINKTSSNLINSSSSSSFNNATNSFAITSLPLGPNGIPLFAPSPPASPAKTKALSKTESLLSRLKQTTVPRRKGESGPPVENRASIGSDKSTGQENNKSFTGQENNNSFHSSSLDKTPMVTPKCMPAPNWNAIMGNNSVMPRFSPTSNSIANSSTPLQISSAKPFQPVRGPLITSNLAPGERNSVGDLECTPPDADFNAGADVVIPETSTELAEELHALLKKYYGYSEFRPGQLEILTAIIENKRDSVGVLATGVGKSLTFQLPALRSGKIAICISPLISLMDDQCNRINQSLGKIYNQTKARINFSGGQLQMSFENTDIAMSCRGANSISMVRERIWGTEDAKSESANGLLKYCGTSGKSVKKIGLKKTESTSSSTGGAKSESEPSKKPKSSLLFLYFSPEKLDTVATKELIQDLIKEEKVCCIAIDEAHCVSEWGHDFRPSYQRVGQALNLSGGKNSIADKIRRDFTERDHSSKKVPILALTATAPMNVQKDIIRSLGLQNPFIYRGDFFRRNLKLQVQTDVNCSNYVPGAFAKLNNDAFISEVKQAIREKRVYGQATIIYCQAQVCVENMREYLQDIVDEEVRAIDERDRKEEEQKQRLIQAEQRAARMLGQSVSGTTVASQKLEDMGFNFESMGFSQNTLSALNKNLKEAVSRGWKPKENVNERLFDLEILQYHAGLSEKARYRAHMGFLTGMVKNESTGANRGSPIIICTIAFGMGIDKVDTRRIIHWGAPRTLESYYQQIGRAGRDGLMSTCKLYCCGQDWQKFLYSEFYHPKLPDGTVNKEQKKVLDNSTMALRRMCENDDDCRQALIVAYLEQGVGSSDTHAPDGRRYKRQSIGVYEQCGVCDNCLRKQEMSQYSQSQNYSQELNSSNSKSKRKLPFGNDGVQSKNPICKNLEERASNRSKGPEDFSAPIYCVLSVLNEWNKRGKTTLIELLLANNEKKLTSKFVLKFNQRNHQRKLFGCFKALAEILTIAAENVVNRNSAKNTNGNNMNGMNCINGNNMNGMSGNNMDGMSGSAIKSDKGNMIVGAGTDCARINQKKELIVNLLENMVRKDLLARELQTVQMAGRPTSFEVYALTERGSLLLGVLNGIYGQALGFGQKRLSETKNGALNAEANSPDDATNRSQLLTSAVLEQIAKHNAGSNNIKIDESCVFFGAPKVLVEARKVWDLKRKDVIQEIKESGYDLSKVPENERERGEGAHLEAELKWQRYLKQPNMASSPEKLQACAGLIQNLETWRIEEATRLRVAPGAILPDELLKRVAYATTHGKITPDILHGIGMRTGDYTALAKVLTKWQGDVWNRIGNSTNAEVNDDDLIDLNVLDSDDDVIEIPDNDKPQYTIKKPRAKTNGKLPLPVDWVNSLATITPIPKANAFTETVRESAELYAQGYSVEIVAVKRTKQIAPTTVIQHINVALANGYTKFVSNQDLNNPECNLVRLRDDFFPTIAECVMMEQAYDSHPDIERTEVQPCIAESLAGEKNFWYAKLKMRKQLKMLGYPFETVLPRRKKNVMSAVVANNTANNNLNPGINPAGVANATFSNIVPTTSNSESYSYPASNARPSNSSNKRSSIGSNGSHPSLGPRSSPTGSGTMNKSFQDSVQAGPASAIDLSRHSSEGSLDESFTEHSTTNLASSAASLILNQQHVNDQQNQQHIINSNKQQPQQFGNNQQQFQQLGSNQQPQFGSNQQRHQQFGPQGRVGSVGQFGNNNGQCGNTNGQFGNNNGQFGNTKSQFGNNNGQFGTKNGGQFTVSNIPNGQFAGSNISVAQFHATRHSTGSLANQGSQFLSPMEDDPKRRKIG